MKGNFTVHPDPAHVFDDAIACGFLSDDLHSADYAGLYMYMYHDHEGRACFKHIDTRRYHIMPVTASSQHKQTSKPNGAD